MMQNKLYYLLFALVVFAFALLQACRDTAAAGAEEKLPEKISYNFDIRPILSDNCFACHGPDPNTREAGLRLDMAEHAYKALAEHPSAHALVPGKPALSEAFRRITTQDTTLMMPPAGSNLKLTAHQVDLIQQWIKQGAAYEPHWAFTAPRKPELPQVQQKEWVKNELDHFILEKLEQKGITPNEPADKERLLKRVSFDLTGMPPSLELMDGFLADTSARAYEKVVDKLLKSPAYGEKMALHWLDVARYADSYGYQMDNLRTQWPWRDWVIHAFNQNLPYDQFITWQLAGDLMPRATKEQLLATGFNRNHKITEEGAVDEEEYRVTYVTDRTNTFSKALLGVTMECANCHDHKYDPFSQKEYFQLFAFFNNVDERRTSTSPIDPTVGKPESYAKKPLMEISDEDVKDILAFVHKTDTSRLIVSVMGDLDTRRKTHVLARGVYDAPQQEVQPGTPASILPFASQYAPNRLGLAQWLFDKKHPLTARVFVNRVWQEIFGRGLVKSAGDFGMQGELPSHPALLDWLAVDFRQHGWDIKRLVKQIVTSATYRQSTVATAEKRRLDPDNIFLARAPRHHLPAEFIRDLVLSSSGLLVKTLGGPSVKPYQPEGLWEGATAGGSTLATYQQDHGASLYRRGLYTFIKRTVPPPAMTIFDASNRDQCEVKRSSTNTPLQALVMMNDPTVLEASRVLAAKLLKEKIRPREKIRKAFRLIVCRQPGQQELTVLADYYGKRLKTLNRQKAQELLQVGEYPLPAGVDTIALAALMQVLHTIYNLEEAITKS
jgi:hypothetical protein